MKYNKLTKWIVNLSPTKTFWLFGLFFPFYAIWLRQVGLYTITKNNKDHRLFKILSTFLLLGLFGLFSIGYVFQYSNNNIPDWTIPVLPTLIILTWFICNGIVSKNMVDYENMDNEYFFGFRKTKEYVFRFFQLFYFPFSIYWIQKDLILKNQKTTGANRVPG